MSKRSPALSIPVAYLAAAVLVGCNPEGSSGGPCYGNGSCDDGLTCQSQLCVGPDAGRENGPCRGDGTCDPGLGCVDNKCVEEAALADAGSGDGDGDRDAGGSAPDAGEGDAGDGDGDPSRWLDVVGNRIYDANGDVWAGHGANIQDTRGCASCTFNPPYLDEVLRRLDVLVDDWHADFVRLDLEAYAASEATRLGLAQYGDILTDPGYLEDLRAIVDHVGSKGNVHIMLSLWVHPSFSELGWPTAETIPVWEALANEFLLDDHVVFGLANEPEANFDGTLDAEVWGAMNATVDAIRAVETAGGAPYHLVAVQGTRGWAGNLDYYVDHPIIAGDGANVVYEIHVYDAEPAFADLFIGPSETLPVLIGEYGPAGAMTEADCEALQDVAEAEGLPHLAWTFHMRCPPNLLVDNSGGGCGIGMDLEPTSWGEIVRDHLNGVP